ncbi:hypothetical protein [Actinomadura sp. 6K520]|uniref:Rv1678 family membrane protein n=1 Tax=Actinomadura sp. 6K520 TaxID=2530364 RepID=UPI0010535400|nr:hypothetical protein [Actinomadura sp. 6K520]TDE19704.1 hypothetical protein E1289_33035 [Actinomadura sp. 6K520]
MRASDRAVLVLGLASLFSIVFTAADGDPWEMVAMPGTAVVIAAVLGVAAGVAGLLGLRVLALAAGAAFVVAAVIVPVEQSLGEQWIEGTGSTFSLWLGLGAGLMAAGLARRDEEGESHGS